MHFYCFCLTVPKSPFNWVFAFRALIHVWLAYPKVLPEGYLLGSGQLLTLYATIHENNFDSIRFFESADFKMTSVLSNSSKTTTTMDLFTYTLELF